MQFDWELGTLLFVTFVISTSLHEGAHAWVAMLGGDRTAYYAGQVTINPIAHMRREPFGMLILPLLMLLSSHGTSCMGFAHAPYDPLWAERHPKKAAMMSAAGPLANTLLAAIAFAVLWYIGRPHSGTEEAVRRIAGVFLIMNVLLGTLNLLPLPPLDGAGVLGGLFRPARRFYDAIRGIPYASLGIMILIFYNFEYLFWPVFHAINRQLPYMFSFR